MCVCVCVCVCGSAFVVHSSGGVSVVIVFGLCVRVRKVD